MSTPPGDWTEQESVLYREIAAAAVPAREEQIAILLALVPRGSSDSFRVLDVGSGAGALSHAVLEAFPHSRVVALDGSASMREHAGERLRAFSPRFEVADFDLRDSNWRFRLQGTDVVFSSLCLHHLDGREKKDLFAAVCDGMTEDGVFLIADLVEPPCPEARELFALSWDRDVRQRSRDQTGSERLFERFRAERWNYYQFPDPVDRPSRLFDQLCWLDEAGFEVVDCFWLRSGHAIYGGYKTRTAPAGRRLSWHRAVEAAENAVRVTG